MMFLILNEDRTIFRSDHIYFRPTINKLESVKELEQNKKRSIFIFKKIKTKLKKILNKKKNIIIN